jgi:hypothetical protein
MTGHFGSVRCGPTYPPRQTFMVKIGTTSAAVDKSAAATPHADSKSANHKGRENGLIVTDPFTFKRATPHTPQRSRSAEMAGHVCGNARGNILHEASGNKIT